MINNFFYVKYLRYSYLFEIFWVYIYLEIIMNRHIFIFWNITNLDYTQQQNPDPDPKPW